MAEMRNVEVVDKLLDEFIESFDNLPQVTKDVYLNRLEERFKSLFAFDANLHNEEVNQLYKSYIYKSLLEKKGLSAFKNNLNFYTSVHNDSIDILKELSPKHNSEVLLILGWAGKLKNNKLDIITDLNPILKDLILKHKCNRCKIHEKIKHFITIDNLLNCIIGNHTETELVNKIVELANYLVENYQTNFSTKTLTYATFQNWKNSISLIYEDQKFTIHFFAKYLNQLDESDRVILGLNVQTKSGIKFQIDKEKSKYYDPFLVFHFSDNNKKIIGVQGVFVPVDLRYESYKHQLKQSNRNAIAKVMARNMSHHIGSHVLSRMVDPNSIEISNIISGRNLQYTSIKESIAEEDKNKRINKKFEEIKSEYWKNPNSPQTNDQQIRDTINDFLKEQANKVYYNDLISYFFSYLKTRQALLADIVTGTPQVQNSKWFIKEIMTGIDSNRLLLNRISGVENLSYKFKFEGDVCKCCEKLCACCEEKNDVQVAISTDIVGQHCIYIILENIIRNTAKHGKKNYIKNSNTELNFTIRVVPSTTDSSHYKIIIYDNVLIKGYSYLKIRRAENKEQPYDWYENEREEFAVKEVDLNLNFEEESVIEIKERKHQQAYLQRPYSLRIYIGTENKGNKIYDYYKVNNIDQLVIQQNIWINEPILDQSTFDLRQGALGLIEMEVCAAYLRSIPVEDIEAPEFDLKFAEKEINDSAESTRKGETKLRLLRAVRELYNDKTKTGSLGYCFYLPKPKELLVIDIKGSMWNSLKEKGNSNDTYSEFKKLESYGILLLTICTKLGNDPNWCYDPNKTYKHSLMLVIDDTKSKVNKLSFHKLPKRIVSYKDAEKHFVSYKKKFEKGGLKEIVFYEVSLDITQPKAFLREIWRSYIINRMEKEKIQKFKINNLNHLVPHRESGKIYRIKYDHHGVDLKEWTGKYHAIFESKFKDLEKHFTPINKDGALIITQFKAIDAALTNIAVIDERIQELSKNKYTLEGGSTKEYQEIWNYMNVYIPPKTEINLSVKSFEDDYTERLIKIIQQQFGENSIRQKSGLDFILIHLGILEKILNSQKGKSKDKEDDISILINQISNAVSPPAKVILTSGRAPSELPKKVSFLSYSLLSQYLIEYRFKLLLSDIMYASRPKS